MKKLLLIIFLLPAFCFGQELAENKVDEFTKHTVKRTSYEPLIQSGKWYVFFRVSKINDIEYLDMKMIYYKNNTYQAITQGMNLMLMLQNDSIVSLANLKSEISCRGCGARGFSGSGALGIAVSYLINPEDHQAIKSQPIKKIRVYTTDGYIEDEIKEKRSTLFSDLIKLIE